jgi:hypothetical protein
VIFFASFVYGGGFIVAGLRDDLAHLVLRADRARLDRGGTVMTLAWGLLFKLMPGASRRRLRARDDDEGLGLLLGAPVAAPRSTSRGRSPARRPAIRSSGSSVRDPDPRRDPARRRMMRIEPSGKVEPTVS